MDSADITDGVYAWPEGLSHYIKAHGVWLPEEFIKHSTIHGANFDTTKIDKLKIAPKEDTW